MAEYKNQLQLASATVQSDEKLTDWANEPSTMMLREDLAIAKPLHDLNVSKVNNWLDLRNIEGKARVKAAENRSKVQPKLIRRQNEWRYSALTEPFLSSEKVITASPRTWEDKQSAEQNEIVINHQIQTQLNWVNFIDEYVRTNVDEGTVYVRVGWDRETTIEMVEAPVYEYVQSNDPAFLEQLQQAMELEQTNPRGFRELPEELQESLLYSQEVGMPVMATVVDYELVEEENIQKNQPTLSLVDHENIYYDPNCEGDLSKAGFVIISWETSKAELIKDGRYKNLDRVNWASQSPLQEPDHATYSDHTTQFKDDLRKRVVAYEYWGLYDINNDEKLVPILATWIGNTMVRMELNPFPDQSHPIVAVRYMPVKKSVAGETDAELLSENQAIQGAVTRGMIDLMGRSANGQTGFAKGMLDVVNRKRYNSGADYEFNPNMPPQAGMIQHTYPEIPNSALTMLQMQNQEAEALTGVKAFSGGLSGDAYGNVATGIRGVLDAAAKREMSILRRLAKGIEMIATKIIQMNAVFLSEEETIRISNSEYVTVKREDLKGNFDIKVSIATAEVDEAKAQDIGFLLQTMGNTVDFGITKMLLEDLVKLKRMPELAQKIKNYNPEPDPVAVQIQQLELQKLQLEIEEIQSRVELNRAKAKKEASEADLKDLDFVEQETGTKHARDMARQQSQSAGNAELEITKRLLAPDEEGKQSTKGTDVASALVYQSMADQLTS